jgi:erythronate-4-phosphate dehydrogenase
MRIVADANMCEVGAVFAALGSVVELEGRAIGNADLAGAEILLVRSVTRVDTALLDNTPLRFVGTATSGYDHVDREALRLRGIHFAHAPGSNANSVLEYVMSAIASCDDFLERLCSGGRVGIIGFGVIGRRLYQRLRALGISSVAYDPWLDSDTHTALVGLEEVLACDVISIHAELTRRQPWPSVHLLNADTLRAIRPDSLLISAGRGAVVDNRALLRALQASTAFTAVLDVWEHEPEVDRELLALCRFGTPHIAGYSYDGKLLATRMLYAQTCMALGLEARDEATSDPATQPGFEVPAQLDGADLIRWLQAQSYDIGADDARLRAELDRGFDRLRRLYPNRRELGAFAVTNYRALSPTARQICAAMGCGGP